MHLVWDWNGTLFDDFSLVLAATNASLAAMGGPTVTAEQHRREFRRPIWSFYSHVLGRPVTRAEFTALDRAFHTAYRAGLSACRLAADAVEAVSGWTGGQSLLSMWFHDELVATVARYGIAGRLDRVDGLREPLGGGAKAPHLVAHLNALGVNGPDCVLVGDSLDDADAAAHVGARVVLYAGGFTDEARLHATGLPVAATLTEAIALAVAG